MTYRVAIDQFHGPLDLLLHLVRRQEVDIHDIPIAVITAQFLEYLQVLEMLDVEQAGDFLVMAATLMEIKSRALLPVEAAADEAAVDPRRDLVRQLLEYRRFKDAAVALEERAEAQAARLPRQDRDDAAPSDASLQPVELWDLVNAFARLMRETQTLQARTITIDDTPQEVYERQLLGLIAAAGGRLNFRQAFQPPYHRLKLIGLFLAMLELIKRGAIDLEQPEPFAEIILIAQTNTPA